MAKAHVIVSRATTARVRFSSPPCFLGDMEGEKRADLQTHSDGRGTAYP